MKTIVVLVKEVPDPAGLGVSKSKAQIFEREKRIINPNDRFALELALQLKDKVEARIVTVTAGAESTAATLKELYALGADEVVLLAFENELSKNQVASAIANYLKETDFDLVLAGSNSTINNLGEVPQRVAAELDLPFKAEISDLEDTGERFVATVKPESNKPRRPSAKMILLSRKKEVKVVKPDFELPEPDIMRLSTELP